MNNRHINYKVQEREGIDWQDQIFLFFTQARIELKPRCLSKCHSLKSHIEDSNFENLENHVGEQSSDNLSDPISALNNVAVPAKL